MLQVLVIEDDRRVADFLVRGLRAEGLGVEVAHDGPEGLRLALDWSARLADQAGVILLDRMLPGLDGATLCRACASKAWTRPC